MKRSYFLLVLLAVASLACAQSLFVGTYNIRNHNSGDDAAGNVWNVRCKVICDQINFEDPDIFGTQEVLHAQLGDLTAALDADSAVDNASDNFLQVVRPTDIAQLLERLPLCRTIIVTGQKSAETLQAATGCPPLQVGENVETELAGRKLKIWRMPSSSRAYPRPVEWKAEYYKKALDSAGGMRT